MPNFNKETVRLMRQRRVKVAQRLTKLGNRIDLIVARFNDEGTALSAEEYNKLLSEFRVLERSFDAAKEEHRILLLF